MKIKYMKSLAMLVFSGALLTSCNDYLDKEPKSYVTPENYLNTADQLASYANKLYTAILPSHGNWSYGLFGNDNQTDNQTGMNYDDKYVKGKWKVPLSGGNWSFGNINNINYFFEQVMPKYEAGKLSGDQKAIRHYIGEMHFFRALEYFKRYKAIGDFPIIKTPLIDNLSVLVEASKRFPRNQVARFILEDLDKVEKTVKLTP